MNVSYSTLSRLENGHIEFSPFYESKFRQALQRLHISDLELASIRIIVEAQETRKRSDKA